MNQSHQSPNPEQDLNKTRPLTVTAFVDWNTQIHHARTTKLDPEEKAKLTLAKTTKSIARALARHRRHRFLVTFRLYHGWHKGWQRTINLQAIITAAAEREPARWPNAVFSNNVEYGHTLLSALPRRLRNNIHLPNTLRQQASNKLPNEKMVDTALAADLLYWAKNGTQDWALVLSEDDDIIPPVLSAEASTVGTSRRVFILKTKRWNSHLVDLSDLLLEP